jgi:hypothetical protein
MLATEFRICNHFMQIRILIHGFKTNADPDHKMDTSGFKASF